MLAPFTSMAVKFVKKTKLHLLVSICNCKQHASAVGGWFSSDGDGKVVVKWVGDEGLCEAAHVGVRAEAVGRVTLESSDEGD